MFHGKVLVVLCPDRMGRFEFVALARLRAQQLTRGCIPRIGSVHLRAVTAQLEVALGHVERLATPPEVKDTSLAGTPPPDRLPTNGQVTVLDRTAG
jgi:hypothetical protein